MEEILKFYLAMLSVTKSKCKYTHWYMTHSSEAPFHLIIYSISIIPIYFFLHIYAYLRVAFFDYVFLIFFFFHSYTPLCRCSIYLVICIGVILS